MLHKTAQAAAIRNGTCAAAVRSGTLAAAIGSGAHVVAVRSSSAVLFFQTAVAEADTVAENQLNKAPDSPERRGNV